MRAWDEWRRFCRIYESQMGGEDMELVCAALRSGVVGNFQSFAYGRLFVRGSSLFFSFRRMLVENPDLSERELCAVLWGRMVRAVEDERACRGGGRVSLLELFVDWFVERVGWERSPQLLNRARVLFFAWLANSLVGVVLERRCFVGLVGLFGAGEVVWGSESDESDDVDLYVRGLPVSCKCGGAFSVGTFSRYRFGKGCSRPVLYVNDGLDAYVFSGGEFVFVGADQLVELVNSLVD